MQWLGLVDAVNISIIDLIEMVATKLDFRVYRAGETDISVLLSNNKSEYQLFVELRQDIYEALYFSCDMDITIAKEEYATATVAIVKANEHSWLGHFDLTSTDSQIMYSFTLPFASAVNYDEINIELLLGIILDECERFRQYFSMALENNGNMSDQSINTLFFDAIGEA